MIVTTRLKPVSCPTCRYEMDAATAVFAAVRPKPGDVTVCINCAALLQFANDMSLILANTHELTLDVLDQLAEAQAAVKKMHREQGKVQ
jgi:hypothetical protein